METNTNHCFQLLPKKSNPGSNQMSPDVLAPANQTPNLKPDMKTTCFVQSTPLLEMQQNLWCSVAFPIYYFQCHKPHRHEPDATWQRPQDLSSIQHETPNPRGNNGWFFCFANGLKTLRFATHLFSQNWRNKEMAMLFGRVSDSHKQGVEQRIDKISWKTTDTKRESGA